MSDRLKSTNQYSNEEIIDDLTKDLKSSFSTEEDSKEFVIGPEAADKDDDQPYAGDAPSNTETDHLDEDCGKDDDKSDNDTDDEELLKKEEETLTADQKEERKLMAEELKVAGNNAYKGEEFDRSIEKYTEALKICPLQYSQQRSVLYCNRGAAKMKLSKYRSAVRDCRRAVKLDDKYLKAYFRKAQSYEAIDKLDESLSAYQKVVELDPTHVEAQRAVRRLPPLIEERNEKLKTEMFGKLKDLGNMILKPFGLSTENFKLEQDPESKGYKINFNQ